MTVTRQKLLNELPPFTNDWILVKEKQNVKDIIKLILAKHKDFSSDYDRIAKFFVCDTVQETCDQLYSFCKKNLHYLEESEENQIVGNPASILARGETGVDCKSYALFIGGCLDAIARTTNENINWHYCFASYELSQQTPYHVFVVVNTDGNQLYVDPTPGSENKEPVWIINKWVATEKNKRVGLIENKKTMSGLAGPVSSYGELMPAPHWYPAHLPLFYKTQVNSGIPGVTLNWTDYILRPLNAVPNYTENDVLDTLLYLQTLIGYNRIDWQNWRSAAWAYRDGSGSAKMWVQSAFKQDANGDGSGNFANISTNNQSIDGALYAKLQARYIFNERTAMPWLSSMQAKGGGIQLETIPMGNDREVPRPSWYADYLPSLFYSAGNSGQQPAGFLATKPKIRGSGYKPYAPTPQDCAMYMLYAQPEIYKGPTPYPLNWYVNDDVNGAMFSWFAITLAFAAGHNNSQMQERMIATSILNEPDLDADPYSSGFSHLLQTVVSAAINFFAGKIPGGTKLVQAAYMAGNISGGQMITGGPMPPGVFSAAVFKAADDLNTKIATDKKNKELLLFGLFAAVALGYYYWDDLKKQF